MSTTMKPFAVQAACETSMSRGTAAARDGVMVKLSPSTAVNHARW
jgi:hypothetical protein